MEEWRRGGKGRRKDHWSGWEALWPCQPAAAHRELSIAGVPTQLPTLFILDMNINEGLLKYSHSSRHMQEPPGQSVSPRRLHALVLVLLQTCLVWSVKNQLVAHCLPFGDTQNYICALCVSVCVCVRLQALFHACVCRCLSPCLSVCPLCGLTVNPCIPLYSYPSVESCF